MTGSGRKRLPLHPMLVTIPIGTWVASLIFDVLSYTVAEPGFLIKGASWLIGIGLVGAAPAGIAGLVDAMPVPSGTSALNTVMWHLGLTMLVWLLFAVSFLLHTALPMGRPVPVWPISLSAGGVLVVGGAAFAGWTLAHRHGVPGAYRT